MENIYRKFNFIPGKNAGDLAIQDYLDEFKNEYNVEEHEIHAKYKVYLITSKNLDPDETAEDENFEEDLLCDAIESLSSGGIGVLMDIVDVDIFSGTDFECFEELEKTKVFIPRPDTEKIS